MPTGTDAEHSRFAGIPIHDERRRPEVAVQARFYVSNIEKTPTEYTTVRLLPVTRDKSNAGWSKYTPSGELWMNVHNSTGAAQWFEERLGKDIAITFEDRDAEEEPEAW
jgi:hypothetical protein